MKAGTGKGSGGEKHRNPFAKQLGSAVLLLVACNLVYLLLMTVIFALPLQDRVRRNVEQSLYTWKQGLETEAPVFDDNRLLWNDTRGEMQMADIVLTTAGSVPARGVALYWKFAPDEGESDPVRQYKSLETLVRDPDDNSLSTETYERYWFLIVGVLRLLYCALTIGEIRWLMYACGTLLAGWLLCRVYRRCGMRGVFPLILAFLSRNLLLHAAYAVTAMDVWVSLASMIALSYIHDRAWFRKNRYLYYCLLGSVTFAIGPLIAPLLTLGMTLVFQIQLTGEKDSSRAAWTGLFTDSAFWAAGYVLTMGLKTLVSLIAVRHAEGFQIAAGYMETGTGSGMADRIAILLSCVERAVMPKQATLLIGAVFIAVLAVLAIRHGLEKPPGILLTLAVSLYPVLWVLVVSGHSRHDYAVNVFAVTVYGICSLLAGCTGNGKAA